MIDGKLEIDKNTEFVVVQDAFKGGWDSACKAIFHILEDQYIFEDSEEEERCKALVNTVMRMSGWNVKEELGI